MILELTREEQDLLTGMLQRELDELGPEIHHTWVRGYRDELKTERRMLRQLVEKLQVPHAVG